MFYLVIASLVISCSALQTEAVKVSLRQIEDIEDNDAGNDTRIIGGRPIWIWEAPWQVAMLFDGNELACGGSVITKRHILTAAHCVVGYKPSELKIRAGSRFLTRGGQVRRISRMVYDAAYNANTSNNDIAVLKLRSPLQINLYVTPVKLASFYQPASGFASVSGWGKTRETAENTSAILRAVTVQMVSLRKCREDYRRRNIIITANMLCAGATNGGRDACQGDSGGPLVEDDTLYGVVSMGFGCGRRNFPGVYTSVARKKKWILKVLARI